MITIKENDIQEVLITETGEHALHFVQKANSTLRLCVITLPGEDADFDITVEHNGEGCTTLMNGVVIANNEQTVNIKTHVLHNIGHGYSNQKFKFLLADKAQGQFYGELKVMPDAQKTEAYQTNRNILLSSEAKMRTEPQLEIYADDVKCSHGASTGELDTSALFYMQQRCISPETGRRMLISAFCKDVLDVISSEEKREESIDAIDRVIEQL